MKKLRVLANNGRWINSSFGTPKKAIRFMNADRKCRIIKSIPGVIIFQEKGSGRIVHVYRRVCP